MISWYSHDAIALLSAISGPLCPNTVVISYPPFWYCFLILFVRFYFGWIGFIMPCFVLFQLFLLCCVLFRCFASYFCFIIFCFFCVSLFLNVACCYVLLQYVLFQKFLSRVLFCLEWFAVIPRFLFVSFHCFVWLCHVWLCFACFWLTYYFIMFYSVLV